LDFQDRFCKLPSSKPIWKGNYDPVMGIYTDYIDSLNLNTSLHSVDLAKMLQESNPDSFLLSRYHPGFFLIDFIEKSFCMMSLGYSKIFGYDIKYFLENGLDSYREKINSNYFEVLNNKVLPANLAFLTSFKHSNNNDFIFSWNYEFTTKDGKQINIMQRCSYILDPKTNLPIGAFGFANDVTNFCQDHSIIQTIEEVEGKNGGRTFKTIFKKVHYVIEEHSQLTKREIEVAKWICEGLSSKQIANKLNISINTIHNHRQNMLHKTSCQNSLELLSHLIKNRII
jgi:DNA-binding CsgD family transcriptional regulator